MTNEDRQTVTQREAFEAWMVEHGGRGGMEQSVSNPGNYMSGVIQLAWIAWQAATLAERERCAKVCERKRMARGGEVFAAEIRRG